MMNYNRNYRRKDKFFRLFFQIVIDKLFLFVLSPLGRRLKQFLHHIIAQLKNCPMVVVGLVFNQYNRLKLPGWVVFEWNRILNIGIRFLKNVVVKDAPFFDHQLVQIQQRQNRLAL